MKRVIILSRQSLFGTGLESMISREQDIEIVTWDRQLCDFMEFIRKNNPNAIIINCDDPNQDITPAILCALQEQFEMIIIGLSLSNNSATVYRGIQKQILCLDDWLTII